MNIKNNKNFMLVWAVVWRYYLISLILVAVTSATIGWLSGYLGVDFVTGNLITTLTTILIHFVTLVGVLLYVLKKGFGKYRLAVVDKE